MKNLDLKTVDNIIAVAVIITCSVDIVLRLRDIFKKPKEPEVPDFDDDELDDDYYDDLRNLDVYEINVDSEDDEWDIK
ncbi:MAG: hypothetical protein IKH13_10620 [Clostridia bacterium]|nr:hypothetical protein [Clostridia bacterium]